MYETFLIDVGLNSNVFFHDYNALEYLAKDNWFKHLWLLCHQFKCDVTLNFPDNPQRVRVGDKALIKVFLESGIFDRKQIMIFQRV